MNHEICAAFLALYQDYSADYLNKIPVQVHGFDAIALLDTGASCSILTQDFFQEIKEIYNSANLDVIRVQNDKVKTMDFFEIKLKGKLTANVHIKEDMFLPSDMYVTKTSLYNILGKNSSQKFERMVVDYVSGLIALKKNNQDYRCEYILCGLKLLIRQNCEYV